jgi:hypothetical protein
MALVERFHVVAAEKAVNTSATIKEGQIVSLAADATVILQSTGTYTRIPYGLAGDTKSTSTSYMPGVASGWQNRVSDYYDETKASAKITVYHSGGEFATDQFKSNVVSATIGQTLYGNLGLLDTSDEAGTTTYPVARLITAAGPYPSGVPGVDINGDIALAGDTTTGSGGNTYIEIKLLV